MKNFKKIISISVLLTVFGLLVFGAVNRVMAKSEAIVEDLAVNEINEVEYGKGNGNSGGFGNGIEQSKTPVAEEFTSSTSTDSSVQLLGITQPEIDVLLYMREEEKLARDVYSFLASQWDLPVFTNIASSEQTHMDSVLMLINTYGLTDSDSGQVGVFKDPTLQSLYTQLTAQGSLSIEEAFKVGAAIEEIDIVDLQEGLSKTGQLDIRQVYENLLSGSYNHLSAFSSNLLNRSGVTYVPQYLTADEYQTIISVDTTGGGSGFGQGSNGRGNH